jgi:hypothetical protein
VPSPADGEPGNAVVVAVCAEQGQGSVDAEILRIAAPTGAHRLSMLQPAAARAQAVPAEVQMSTAELDAKIRSEVPGTLAAVGLTSRCPYGLGACWGGAYEALQKLDGVQAVRPIANAEDSPADVYLHGDTLPNVERWAEQIARVANGSYDFRGIEVSVKATVEAQNGGLRLTGPSTDKPVVLAPLEQGEKIQFDRARGTPELATADELGAYDRLFSVFRTAQLADLPVRVTGPLRMRDNGWVLQVRSFED